MILISELLVPLRFLGQSNSTVVEGVRCRRILLARKLIRWRTKVEVSRRIAMREVEHLQRLRHPHILRMVGTYVCTNQLGILLYPVAEYHLGDFMDSIFEDSCENSDVRITHLKMFFSCLAETLRYIHQNCTKHMDIKPQNLLVRDMRQTGKYLACGSGPQNMGDYKIYVADFGISRSYSSVEEANTENPTAFTWKYAAPEVVTYEKRGLSADIFSLGCVFAEMLAAISQYDQEGVEERQRLTEIRVAALPNSAYAYCIPQLLEWLDELYVIPSQWNAVQAVKLQVRTMLCRETSRRPAAEVLAAYLGGAWHCLGTETDQDPFEESFL
jgi:serine/threonine protein kinase